MNLLVSFHFLFFSVFTCSIKLHYFPAIFSSPDTLMCLLVLCCPMGSLQVFARCSQLSSIPQSTAGMVLFSTWIQHTANAITFSMKENFRFLTFQTSLLTTKVLAVPVNCPTEVSTALGQCWFVLCIWQSCRFIRWTWRKRAMCLLCLQEDKCCARPPSCSYTVLEISEVHGF